MADIRVIVYQSTSANPYAVSINYLWKPAQDFSSSAVETNQHFFNIVYPNQRFNVLPLLRQQQDWSSSSVFAAQPETNPHFRPKFTQPQYIILPALRQNQAITVVIPPTLETNPPFIGRFTQPTFNILVSLRQQQDWASTFQFAPPTETHYNFIGKFKPYQFYVLQSLRQQVETAFSGVPPPIVMGASYRLLSDHWVVDMSGANVYHNAGDIVMEGRDIPFGWPPTLASEPLNTQAIQQYWNIGPRGMLDAEPQRDFYVKPFNLVPPSIKWVRVGGTTLFQLTGAGASLGAKDGMDP